MKIEIWSDYVCPFCYIGKRTLEQALHKSGFKDQTEIIYKAYQLDPDVPVDSAVPVYTHLAKKMGTSIERAKETAKGVAQHAQNVGLEFDFDGMVQANTIAAHRLAKWAETQGKGGAITERLLRAYFVEARNVGRQDVLMDVIHEAGLSTEEARTVLASDQFQAEVERDIAEAVQIGVQGVPFFVVNNKYAISGAQPLEAFVEALTQIAEEEGIRPKLKPLGKKPTSYCTGESCDG